MLDNFAQCASPSATNVRSEILLLCEMFKFVRWGKLLLSNNSAIISSVKLPNTRDMFKSSRCVWPDIKGTSDALSCHRSTVILVTFGERSLIAAQPSRVILLSLSQPAKLSSVKCGQNMDNKSWSLIEKSVDVCGAPVRNTKYKMSWRRCRGRCVREEWWWWWK